MGALSALACIFSLSDLISTLIVVQTMLQFIGQCIAVILLRKRTQDDPSCFHMPLFPLPAIIALAGWSYIVITSGTRYILIGFLLMGLGIAAYLVRSHKVKEWPFRTVE
jgi:amino acid transporter